MPGSVSKSPRPPKRSQTKRPPKPPVPPRWTTRAQAASHDISNILIQHTSDTPQHLFMGYTYAKPGIQPQNRTKLGQTHEHHITVRMPYPFWVEQNEPGQVLSRTFTIPAICGQQQLYYVFTDHKPPQPHHSISPVFAVAYDYVCVDNNVWQSMNTIGPGFTPTNRDIYLAWLGPHGSIFPPPARTSNDLAYSLLTSDHHGNHCYSLIRIRLALNSGGAPNGNGTDQLCWYASALAPVFGLTFASTSVEDYDEDPVPCLPGSTSANASTSLPLADPTRDIATFAGQVMRNSFQSGFAEHFTNYRQINQTGVAFNVYSPSLMAPPLTNTLSQNSSSNHGAQTLPAFTPFDYCSMNAVRTRLDPRNINASHFNYLIDISRTWRNSRTP